MRKLIFLILLCGCANTAPRILYSSNAETPFSITQDGPNLTFEFEDKKCLASGFQSTEETKVILPQNSICNTVKAGGILSWISSAVVLVFDLTKFFY